MRSVNLFFLCILMLFSLCACSDTPDETQNASQPHIEQSDPSQVTYPTPTEAETFDVPAIPAQDQLISTDPITTDEWVFTNYEHTFSWRDPDNQYHSMTIILPALAPAAEFAVRYNQSVLELGQLLLEEIHSSHEKGYYPTTLSLTYEVSVREDILFIVMERRMAEGYSMYYVDAFDLEDRKALHLGEVTEELVDMDYPAFILAVTEFVKQAYIRTYESTVRQIEENTYTGTDSYFATEPDKTVENYYNTLDRLPYLTRYLSQSRLFADKNGDLQLYICVPSIDGLDAQRQVVPFDLSALGWKSMPTDDQAYGHLLDIQHYMDGIHTDAYGIMLTEAFFSDPEELMEYAAVESKDSIELIIGLLKYNLYGHQIEDFIKECGELLQEDDLTEKERAFVNAALDAIA